ncbi:MAG: MATE family efflux transporter [Planctomycetota bacterium]
MGQANRLISNVLVTYVRMALTIGIGLLTMRLLLKLLGPVDLGLFGLLGGGLSLIMLISTALSDAAQRHMAYEIGRGDEVALRQVFSTAVIVYLGLGVVIAGVGLALRPAFLYGLNIPPDRLTAAGWVYDLTLLNIGLSVLATPFLAVFLARQAMVQDAVFAFFTSVAGLVAVLLTPKVHSDHLIGYAILITASRLLFMFLQIGRGLLLFPETHFRPRYVQRSRFRDLVSFAGWTFLGSLAWQLRAQGGNILLNIFFGPSVNAAYFLANQASTYMSNFAGTIVRAARPAMVSLEGGGRREDVQRMAFSVSKLTLLASSLVALPVILVPDAALGLWLRDVPPYAAVFVPLVLAVIMLMHASTGHALALAAHGDIGKTMRITFWITLSPLPVAAVLYATTSLSPPWLLVLFAFATLVTSVFRVWYIGRMVDIGLSQWVQRTVLPAAVGIGIGTLATVPVMWVYGRQQGWVLIAVGVCYGLGLAGSALAFSLSPEEKELGARFLGRLRRKPA